MMSAVSPSALRLASLLPTEVSVPVYFLCKHTSSHQCHSNLAQFMLSFGIDFSSEVDWTHYIVTCTHTPHNFPAGTAMQQIITVIYVHLEKAGMEILIMSGKNVLLSRETVDHLESEERGYDSCHFVGESEFSLYSLFFP